MASATRVRISAALAGGRGRTNFLTTIPYRLARRSTAARPGMLLVADEHLVAALRSTPLAM